MFALGHGPRQVDTGLGEMCHASVRSLERYARPGPEAVARPVAATDPARRRR